jgi:hypothetical protein
MKVLLVDIDSKIPAITQDQELGELLAQAETRLS